MVKHLLNYVIYAILLAGCSIYRIDSQDSTLDFYPPKSSFEQVACLEKVERPHEIIGIVTATTDRSRPTQEVINKMRHEAAILGGDAIIDIHSDDFNMGGKSENEGLFKGQSILVHYSAKVIVFK